MFNNIFGKMSDFLKNTFLCKQSQHSTVQHRLNGLRIYGIGF